MAHLEGVDVSHANGEIDWWRVKDAGIAFAMIKATEGSRFVDPLMIANLTDCREAGVAPALYHFYHHDVDPILQATHFLAHIGTAAPGDLPPAIDVEEPGDGAGPISYPKSEVVRRLGAFTQAVEAAIGRAPMIYTYPSAWTEVTASSNAFATTNPLWIASYRSGSPTLAGSWATYTFWQYTDHGEVDGIDGLVDRDRFNGGELELEALRARVLAIGEMALFNQDGRVRKGPGLSAGPLTVLPRGAGVVIVGGPSVANGRDWWKIDDGEGTVGWSSSQVLSAA
jgi:GH25 family lysozyme M1 (1,4-beta-N-acetylmuramidase)